jgi:putative endonuclease
MNAARMRQFHVYILASRTHRLYVGVTGDLCRRVHQHRARRSAFTAKYRVERLVYFEATHSAIAAIAREKQIKGWLRARKIALIERDNRAWDDLYDVCCAPIRTSPSGRHRNTDPSLRSG